MPKKEYVRKFSRNSRHFCIPESLQTCFSRYNFFVSYIVLVHDSPTLYHGWDAKTLIKSGPLVLFFLSLCIFYADAAELCDVSSFPSPFIYCFRPSPSCFSVYDFSLTVRRTLCLFGIKYFFRLRIALSKTAHYYLRFLYS